MQSPLAFEGVNSATLDQEGCWQIDAGTPPLARATISSAPRCF